MLDNQYKVTKDEWEEVKLLKLNLYRLTTSVEKSAEDLGDNVKQVIELKRELKK